MDSSSTNEVAHDFSPYFKVYKDDRIERYTAVITVDAGHDLVILLETGIKAHIFISKIDGPDRKLPVFVHNHGRGFCVGSALGCESAGANIAHFVAVRAGSTIMGLAGLKIEGLVMVHPFFWG
ncbi:hypothetical protein EZV62_011352 [Acer yangbiense]|uniref:Uncharacterized protein n=1 Tax=Acer yangbiense TaxID=1000413 RepID=A0A5C7I5U0_9ROSI|nr:hypothetical protein EZV62_011352 [Acer yangbiense]